MGNVFLVQGDGLVEMEESGYDSEADLQRLLELYPRLLAGDQMNAEEPRRWLLIRREVGLPDQESGADRWSVDHLFLDQDAVPTIVETKRSSNTEIRRKIVGQMMDKRWPDDAWAQDPIQGGANVHSQGCHTTDILRYLGGSEPRKVWAVGGARTHPGHPCIDQCVASIEFESGAFASWIQGDAGLGQFTSKFFFELFADGRSVQLYDRLKKATFFDGEKSWTEQRAEEEGFQLENCEFVNALLEGRAPALTIRDGVAATRLVLAAERAIRTGQVQNL